MSKDDMSLDNAEVLAKIDSFQKQLLKQAEERHALNNKQMGLWGKVIEETQGQNVVLQHLADSLNVLSKSMEDVKGIVQEVQRWVKGDPQIDGTGLIHQQADLAARVKVNEKDIEELKMSRRVALAVVSVLTAIGVVITWLQSSGFVNLFRGK